MCIAVFTLDAGLLARSQYSEGPATGHLDTRFSWFPCVYKQTLRWFPTFQVATTCFSCSPPDLNLLVTNFMFCLHVNNHCHRVTTQLQLINIIIIIINVLKQQRKLMRSSFCLCACVCVLCVCAWVCARAFSILEPGDIFKKLFRNFLRNCDTLR